MTRRESYEIEYIAERIQKRSREISQEETRDALRRAAEQAANIVSSADIRLDQLLQTGATAGQVVTWDAVAGEWVPDDASSLTDPTTTEGDVIYRDGSGLQRLGIGTAGQRLTVNSAETAPEWADDPAFRNIVLNPNGGIAQRLDTPTTPTTIDDTDYGYDRWKILSEIANSVDIQRIGGNTQRYAARLGQVDPTSQQIGTVQYIEGANCQHLRSNEVTLSGSLRCSANVTVKVVVVQWGGTEDVITNDLISSWGSTVTLAANFTVAGTEGSVSLTANTWQDFSHTVTLNSSFNNLCVLLYVTTDIAQNTLLDYEAIKVSEGNFTTPFETRPIGMELALCQRYFQVFNPGNAYFAAYMWAGLNEIYAQTVLLPVQMRAAPTVTDTNPSWSAGFPGTGNNASFYPPGSPPYVTTVGTFDVVYETSVMTLSFIYESTPDDFAGASAGDVGRATFGTAYRAYLDAEL
jgi:hypothetical protein